MHMMQRMMVLHMLAPLAHTHLIRNPIHPPRLRLAPRLFLAAADQAKRQQPKEKLHLCLLHHMPFLQLSKLPDRPLPLNVHVQMLLHQQLASLTASPTSIPTANCAGSQLHQPKKTAIPAMQMPTAHHSQQQPAYPMP